ncbi:MAG: hypothetical protein ACXADF_18550 [Candidatus Thorarchaeota archaeon]|jgi:hypothetical protein
MGNVLQAYSLGGTAPDYPDAAKNEDVVSRLIVNRAFISAYLHIRLELLSRNCTLPKRPKNHYLKVARKVISALQGYNGNNLSQRLLSLKSDRVNADYKYHTIYNFQDAQDAIDNAHSIIDDFDIEVQRKLNDGLALC